MAYLLVRGISILLEFGLRYFNGPYLRSCDHFIRGEDGLSQCITELTRAHKNNEQYIERKKRELSIDCGGTHDSTVLMVC